LNVGVPQNIGFYTEKDLEPKREKTAEDITNKNKKLMNQTKIERLSKELKKLSEALSAECSVMMEQQLKL
jgi:hypothetical protein